ncbi:MAG: nitroreductase family protein [Candidatus Omnitrophica bacterium]|nr:nitroreductase family protein [Candidatus Omnitrophota bacterium]
MKVLAPEILKLIKSRTTTRVYSEKRVAQSVIAKIVDSGIWGPSILAVGFQPWKFLVIENKRTIQDVARILKKKADSAGIGANIILRVSAKVFQTADFLIVVYNDRSFRKFMNRFRKSYQIMADKAELSAISAAIQNMLLTAESLGVGGCWHDSPVVCEKEINALLQKKEPMVAILTFGYPLHKGRRKPRKAIDEAREYYYEKV